MILHLLNLPERSLLVLEDIDCLFECRESKTNISFSTILNVLDGFACKNRLITFMTTNHKDKLDPALTRPGRIDYIFEIKYANKQILAEMYTSYFSDDNFETLYATIKSRKISTAAFHKFLFQRFWKYYGTRRCSIQSCRTIYDLSKYVSLKYIF